MKLVDIENLKLEYGGLAHISPYDFEKTAMYFMEQIQNLPIIDAVEVVRCKNCEHIVEHTEDHYVICKREDVFMCNDENGYCFYGRRRK